MERCSLKKFNMGDFLSKLIKVSVLGKVRSESRRGQFYMFYPS